MKNKKSFIALLLISSYSFAAMDVENFPNLQEFDEDIMMQEDMMPEQEKSPAIVQNFMDNRSLSIESREASNALLKKILANEYVLYTKTNKFHWNVTGKHFGSLHKLFQEHYELLANVIDRVAERIVILGFKSPGTLIEFMQEATIIEEPNNNPDETGMIRQLLADHEMVIIQLRDGIDTTGNLNDMGTNNFLNDLLEKHEKISWMLRAHITE